MDGRRLGITDLMGILSWWLDLDKWRRMDVFFAARLAEEWRGMAGSSAALLAISFL
jgi:hypothetical protein